MNDEFFDAFLAMPYGRTKAEELYWLQFEAAVNKVARRFSDPGLRIRSHRQSLGDLTLIDGVKRSISDCDFTIAVITGNNPNVFWEVGFTQSQGKPTVFLVDEDANLTQIPAMVIGAMRCTYHSKLLQQYVQRRSLPADFVERFKQHLDLAIDAVRGRKEEPVVTMLGDREAVGLPELVASARKRIYVLTTNLVYFSDFERFVVDRGRRVFAFDPAVDNGVRLRVLTLDPESPIVKYRAEQLGFEHDVARFRGEARRSARRFYQHYRNQPNVSIKLYDDLPLQITLIVDDTVVTSVMSRGHRSRENLHFRLSMDAPRARQSFERHFFEVAAAPSKHISQFGWASEPESADAEENAETPQPKESDARVPKPPPQKKKRRKK